MAWKQKATKVGSSNNYDGLDWFAAFHAELTDNVIDTQVLGNITNIRDSTITVTVCGAISTNESV